MVSPEERVRQLWGWLPELCSAPGLPPRQRQEIERLCSSAPEFSLTEFQQAITPSCKKEIFSDLELLSRVFEKRLSKGARIVPSAGTNKGTLSFRIFEPEIESRQLNDIAKKVFGFWSLNPLETLVLNAYPANLRFPDSVHTFEGGARPELHEKILKNLGDSFKNIILVAQPQFLTYCLRNHLLDSVPAKKLHFVLGGTHVPFSYNQFLASSLDLTKEEASSRIISLYGIAEVGLGIGVRLPHQNFFELNPNFFLEIVEDELLLTALQYSDIPILRYQTGDLASLEASEGRVKLDLKGRKPKGSDLPLRAETINERLFANPELLKELTGRFQLEGRNLHLETDSEIDTPTRAQIQSLFPEKVELRFGTLPISNWPDLLRKVPCYG